MDLRSWAGVQFIRHAPSKGGEEVELRVSRMKPSHVLWWQSHVQPIIDRDPNRVDEAWNWLLYAPFTLLVGSVLARRPVGYTVGIVVHDTGHFVPCALTLLLGRNPALDDYSRRSAISWYMTTAPEAALLDIKEYRLSEDRVPKLLGSIALDVAVTHSLNHWGRGRVGLHADLKGGEPLLHWYQRQGMTVLPQDRRLPPGPRRLVRPSDGRYCYFTVKQAREASHRLDYLR